MYKKEQYTDAKQKFEAAHEVQKRLLGTSHPDYLTTCEWLNLYHVYKLNRKRKIKEEMREKSLAKRITYKCWCVFFSGCISVGLAAVS